MPRDIALAEEERGERGRQARGHTFVDVGEIGTKSGNRLEHGCSVVLKVSHLLSSKDEGPVIPVRPIQSLDRFGIQILHGLLVAPAHTVLGTRIPIEGVDGLGDAHL